MREHHVATTINGPYTDSDHPTRVPSSRDRLLASAKRLMAAEGYERVSTAAIAREAGTSESQLVRYFGSKAGLLDAVFNESWALLNPRITQLIAGVPKAHEAITVVLTSMIHMLDRDPDVAKLMLFEGRRVRGDSSDVPLSRGSQDFIAQMERLVGRGQKDGSFRADLKIPVVVSGLVGAAEGMVRDRLLAKRSLYKEADIRLAFEAMVSGLAP